MGVVLPAGHQIRDWNKIQEKWAPNHPYEAYTGKQLRGSYNLLI